MNKTEIIHLLTLLKEDAEMALSGEWDVTTEEGKEGFKNQVAAIEIALRELDEDHEHPIRKVCATCGSEAVKVDAWVRWNEDFQDWEIDDVFEDSWCDECEGECTINDIEL